MYRRASADAIIEIIEESGAQCGVYPHKADVYWFQQQNEENSCDGMYVLQLLPTELPKAMPFVENSAHILKNKGGWSCTTVVQGAFPLIIFVFPKEKCTTHCYKKQRSLCSLAQMLFILKFN